MAIINGQLTSADEVMNAMSSNFVDNVQLLFNAKYIGFNAKLNDDGVPQLKNVFYSTFESDDADVNYGFSYDNTNDLYTLEDLTAATNYIILEADDEDWSDSSGNVRVIQIDAGKWVILSVSADTEVQRAEVIEYLFYNGTSARINSRSNITAIRTSYSDDVGRQIHWGYAYSPSQWLNGTCEGTFANTTTNTGVSTWSKLGSAHSDDIGPQKFEMPTGSVLNEHGGGSGSSDEFGTDTTGDEVNNPATCNLNLEQREPYGMVLIACKGDITWVEVGDLTEAHYDFLEQGGIPLFTLADTLVNEGATAATLIFKDTASESTTNAVPVINSTIDATSSEVISVSADGGSSYTVVNNGEIARPTAGTALWRKIVITRADLSKLDKVTEQSIKYNLY